MKLTEKAAYLKGLAEGMDLDTAKPKNKLIVELLTLVSDMADKIDALEDEIDTHAAYLDELDHDLGDLEAEVWEIDECDCDDDDCDCDCDDDFDFDEDEDDEDEDFEEYEDDDEDEVFYEVTCPSCGEKVYFDETVDPSDITCPACNESFDCEFDEECCCGDCADCEDCEDCDEADKEEE